MLRHTADFDPTPVPMMFFPALLDRSKIAWTFPTESPVAFLTEWQLLQRERPNELSYFPGQVQSALTVTLRLAHTPPFAWRRRTLVMETEWPLRAVPVMETEWPLRTV